VVLSGHGLSGVVVRRQLEVAGGATFKGLPHKTGKVALAVGGSLSSFPHELSRAA
jgi:hypothetical protein